MVFLYVAGSTALHTTLLLSHPGLGTRQWRGAMGLMCHLGYQEDYVGVYVRKDEILFKSFNLG